MPYKDTAKQRFYKHTWYLKNKERAIANIRFNEKLRELDIRKKIKEYLSNHPCVDCGERNWIVLEFDHCRGKKKLAISVMVKRVYPWKIVMEEIKKCDVRCANCHRKKTSRERKTYRFNDKQFLES